MTEPTITEDEVKQVLTKKLNTENFEIVKFSLKMLGEWVGNCGDHAILHVTTKEPEKDYSFFVKLYPQLETVIKFIEATGSFQKEIFIYKLFDLIRDEEIKLVDDVPKCYLSVPKKFLVVENLAEEEFTTVNKHEVLDYDTVKVVLEALAKFHASSLIYQEKKSIKLIDIYENELQEGYFSDSPDAPNRQNIEAAITGILNTAKIFDFPEKLLSGRNFQTVLEEVCRRVYTLAKPSGIFRNVVCHGDLWATNLLLKHEDDKPVKCKLVDFQCARYTPPAQDVMSLLHLTTSREFRKKYMYNLIGIYYTNLEKHVTLAGYDMKKVIPFDEFLASCEEQKVFGMVQTAIYFPLILLKSDVVQEFFKNQENNKEALLVDRSILVKDNISKDEDYKNRIRDTIQDLRDYCDYL